MTLSCGGTAAEEDYTNVLPKHEDSRGAECGTVAHQMLLCWNWGHLVRVKRAGLKQIKCFVGD